MVYSLGRKHLQNKQECLKCQEFIRFNFRWDQTFIDQLLNQHQIRFLQMFVYFIDYNIPIQSNIQLPFNEYRFMKCETQNYFLKCCDELKLQMEIERNDLIQNQIQLFLFLTKISFEIAPTNGKEKEEILMGSLKAQILNQSNHYLWEPVYFTKFKIFLKRDNNMKFFIKQICCYGKQQIIFKPKNTEIYKKQFYTLRQYMKQQLNVEKIGGNIKFGSK
ncbi:unnamed protein product [Paramecium primaurelia]|uniref:Uncharacterized protein n=1 Tax=Paramecium primaurelia TaxID=5886 RepID=A0A8S1PDM4_PARPR|nr:unnamed protein product [Paramecium primaurelia]